MKKAIVTGGTGFIGSWLIQELLDNDFKVTAIVRNKQRLLPEFLYNKNCTVIEKDIEYLIPEDFNNHKMYDIFFHLGWDGVSPEHKNDIKTQIRNIELSINALEVCNAIGGKVFIGAGTVAEYVFCKNIMNVNERQSPNDMYGAAKASAYYFLKVRARQLGQNFIWTIIPSTFGERRTDNNIVTYTIKSLLNKQKPQYGNLDQIWDFLYVSEVVRAIRLIGEYGQYGKIYGIGSGQFQPLRNYIEQIRDIINPELELGIGEIPVMSQQTFSSCVNNFDLIKDTGFIPRICFTDGVRLTIEWMRKTSPYKIGGGIE